MAYKKILQLFRSTNIWETKNIAKAMVEINAKHLHIVPEIAELKDGEPIVARYYNTLESPTFTYDILNPNTDPYADTYSADHIWVEGFDDLAALPASGDVNADSAAFIRVPKAGGAEGYDYYGLTVTATATSGVNSIYGVAFVGKEHVSDATEKLYIEWFDSAADAQGVISGLKYTDLDLEKGFVARVNQKDGKIEPIHGRLVSQDAINITQANYTYELVSTDEPPAEWKDTNETKGTAFPAINNSAPKYFYLTQPIADPAAVAGYYELRKNITIDLVISDHTNNILSQGAHWNLLDNEPAVEAGYWDVAGHSGTSLPAIDANSPEYFRLSDGASTPTYTYYTIANGLTTNINLRALTSAEIAGLEGASNIKEAYKLVGTADGTERQIGATIKIYKDSSLYKVYLGHTDDELKPRSQWADPTADGPSYPGDYNLGSGNDALCFVYQLADGTYSLVAVDVESFMMENEFKDGLEVIQGYRWTPCDESDVPQGYDWTVEGRTFDDESEIPTAASDSPAYVRYGTDPDYSYKRLDHQGEVYVKLATDGGLEFKTESQGNKSVKIKIDASNNFYRKLGTSEEAPAGATKYTKNNMYEWVYDNAGTKTYVYTTTAKPTTSNSAYSVASSGKPVYDTPAVISAVSADYNWYNDGTITVGGTTYTANRVIYDGYIADATNGNYILDTYLETTSAGLKVDTDVLTNKIDHEMQEKLRVNGQGFEKTTDGTFESTLTGNDIKVAEEGKIPTVTPVNATPTTSLADGIYEYNGNIYIVGGYPRSASLYDPTTTIVTEAQATAISMYLAYNLDMGTYTIPVVTP